LCFQYVYGRLRGLRSIKDPFQFLTFSPSRCPLNK
jgi:hypothetical protein